jgi:hypothetical protein
MTTIHIQQDSLLATEANTEIVFGVGFLVDLSTTSISMREPVPSDASLSGVVSKTLESARVWDKIDVSENLTVTFKDTKLSVQKVIDELAKEGVKFYLRGSFDEPGFLDRELAPQFRVVDTRSDQEGSKEVLKEAGLSAAPDNKLENLAVMLILYLKDKSGEELSLNERRLLNCYDNRNRPNGEDYRWVSCGASSSGVFIFSAGLAMSARTASTTATGRASRRLCCRPGIKNLIVGY